MTVRNSGFDVTVGTNKNQRTENKNIEKADFGKNQETAQFHSSNNNDNDINIGFEASERNGYSAEGTKNNNVNLNYNNGDRNIYHADGTENNTNNININSGKGYVLSEDGQNNSFDVNARMSEGLNAVFENEQNANVDIKGSLYEENNVIGEDVDFSAFNFSGGYEDDFVSLEGSGGNGTIETKSGDDMVHLQGMSGLDIDAGDGDDEIYLDGSSANVIGGDGEDSVHIKNGANGSIGEHVENVTIKDLEAMDGLPEGHTLTLNEETGEYTLSNGAEGDDLNELIFKGADTNLTFGEGDAMSIADWHGQYGSTKASSDLPETTINDDSVNLRGKNVGDDYDLDFGNDVAIVDGETSGTISGGRDNDTLRSDLAATDYDNIAFNEETGEYTLTSGDNELVTSNFENYDFADQSFDNLDDFNAFITENFPVDGGDDGNMDPNLVEGDASDNSFTYNGDDVFNKVFDGKGGADTLKTDHDLYSFDNVAVDADGVYTFGQGDNSFTATNIENFEFAGNAYTQADIDQYLDNIAAVSDTNSNFTVTGTDIDPVQDFGDQNNNVTFDPNNADQAGITNINLGGGFDTLNLNGNVADLASMFNVAEAADGFQLVNEADGSTIDVTGGERVAFNDQVVNAANMNDLLSLLQNLLGAA